MAQSRTCLPTFMLGLISKYSSTERLQIQIVLEGYWVIIAIRKGLILVLQSGLHLGRGQLVPVRVDCYKRVGLGSYHCLASHFHMGYFISAYCPSFLYVITRAITKVFWGGQGLFQFTSYCLLFKRSQGVNSNQKLEAKTKDEYSLLICFLGLFNYISYYSPGPPAQGQDYPLLARCSHINRQLRKCFKNVVAGQSFWGNSSVEALSYQVTSLCQPDKAKHSTYILISYGTVYTVKP